MLCRYMCVAGVRFSNREKNDKEKLVKLVEVAAISSFSVSVCVSLSGTLERGEM